MTRQRRTGPVKFSSLCVTAKRSRRPCINSIFTDKQFMDYVKKMQKEIAKRTKASFLRYAANSRIVLTDDDIRIHRMVAYKSKHRIIVLIRVTRDVEIEIEEAG